MSLFAFIQQCLVGKRICPENGAYRKSFSRPRLRFSFVAAVCNQMPCNDSDFLANLSKPSATVPVIRNINCQITRGASVISNRCHHLIKNGSAMKRISSLLTFSLCALSLVLTAQAQSTYEPYYFSTFAGNGPSADICGGVALLIAESSGVFE